VILEVEMESGRFELIIITQHGGQFQGVPGGVGYVDEIIREARLPAESPTARGEEAWLPACLRALNRRFKHQLTVRLVNPMSFYGLYLALRFRFRGYPAVITPDGRLFVAPSPEELIRILEAIV
jgi:hypothetical protein